MRSLITWLPSALRKNMFWLALARFSAQLLSVLVVVVAARRLGPIDFGRYSFYAAALVLGNTFTSFGTETLVIRETAKTRQVAPIAGDALGLQVFLAVVWLFGLLFLRLDSAVLLLSVSLFPLAWFSVCSALLRGFERMDLFWVIVLIQALLQFISAIFAWDLYSFCAMLFAGHFMAGLISVLVTAAALPDFRLPLRINLKPTLRGGLPFALVTVITIASQRLGIFFVALLLDGRAAGLFSVAIRIYEGMKLGHYAMLGALLPVLSRSAGGPGVATIQRPLVYLLGFSVVAAGVVSVTVHWIVESVFGMDYRPASDMAALLIWSLIPYTFSSVMFVEMVSRNLEHLVVKVSVVNLLIAVGIFAWLVQDLGVQGAAYATLLSESIFAILSVVFLRRSV